MAPLDWGASSAKRAAHPALLFAVSLAITGFLLVSGLGHSSPNAVLSARPDPSHLVRGDASCSGGQWQTTHLLVATSGCQAIFSVMYAQNFNNWNASQSYNFSFEIPWIAEVTPAGGLVRLASPLAPTADNTTVMIGPHEVNLSVTQTLNVTSASGLWSPNNTWAGTGTQWHVGNSSLGTATMSVVFHMFNVTANASANPTRNASYQVKFDLGIGGWPWAAAGDSLGLGLESLGAGGSHFAYNQSSRTLADSWNSTDAVFVNLVFGGTANATYPSGPALAASVNGQVGLFYAASPDREAVTLLTFGGVPGNYTSLVYDPWVVFAGASSHTTVPVSPAPSLYPFSFGGSSIWLGVALGLVVVGTAGAVVTFRVLRGARLRREGEELVDGMRRAISDSPGIGNRPP
jgi:hypothetical protein